MFAHNCNCILVLLFTDTVRKTQITGLYLHTHIYIYTNWESCPGMYNSLLSLINLKMSRGKSSGRGRRHTTEHRYWHFAITSWNSILIESLIVRHNGRTWGGGFERSSNNKLKCQQLKCQINDFLFRLDFNGSYTLRGTGTRNNRFLYYVRQLCTVHTT